MMASLNVNGLRSHLDEVKILVNSMGLDILALNETKLDYSIEHQITDINGYKQLRLDRSRCGGGISIYVKDNLKFLLRKDIPVENIELLCIEIQPLKCKSFLFVAWYRPPHDPVCTFQKSERVLSYLDKEGKEIILMGDINCDLSQELEGLSSDSNSRHLLNLYQLFSLKQIIKEPTRVTLSTSTLIDHIATTCTDNVLDSGVHKVALSDHYMVFCKRKLNAAVGGSHKMIKTRNMKKFNHEAFIADVSRVCWENVVSKSSDINVIIREWSSVFSAIIEKHAPIREIRVSDKNSPWITNELKSLMKSRDRLKKAAIKHKSPAMMGRYKTARNKVNNLNVTLKRQYFTNKIIECKGNMKETWKTTNALLNKRSKSTNITSLSVGDIEIHEKNEISNKMNDYFCTIGKELADKIDSSPNPLLVGNYRINEGNKTMKFTKINEQNIRDAIGKIKTSKGFGNDNISSYFLKLALPYIIKSLAYMFNKSLEDREFPSLWKIARVIPIFKDGDKSAKENYRPISVLPVVSRLFEKLVYNQLYEYLNSNDLLAPSQSGFRSLHSTATALLKCTNDWYSSLDVGKHVGVIFVDLKKAFDTVDHKILVQKLAHYGIHSSELMWFKSYLSNRSQFTRVNGVDSKVQNIDIGVPQGSCLGPLLFLLYINDLPKITNNAKVYMYADDTSLSLQNHSMSQLNRALNQDLLALDKWLRGNKLSLNVAKTHSMVISTKRKLAILKNQAEQLHLHIRHNDLDVVQCTKYLGVHIDNTLDWKNHIQEVSKKISRSLGLIRYAKRFLPFESLKNLYTGLVDPHFRYCCAVWGVCGLTELQQLQKLQNCAARIITGSNFDAPSKPLIMGLGWKTIEELIQYETQVLVYKARNGLAPQYLFDMLVANYSEATYNLRNTATDLKLPKRNSSNGQKGFSYKGSKMWNSLPTESKLAPNLASFKTSLMHDA